MYEQLMEAIKIEASRLDDLSKQVVQLLQNVRDAEEHSISFSAIIPDTDRSITDLESLVASIVHFSTGLKIEKSGSFAPRNWVSAFRDALTGSANSFEALGKDVSAITEQHGGVASIDEPNFTVATKNGTPIDFRKPLASIATNLDKLIENYFRLRSAISAPRFSEFGDLFRVFSSRREDIDKLFRDLSGQRNDAAELIKAIRTASKEAENKTASLNEVSKKTTADAAAITSLEAESKTKIEAIRATQKQAEELSAVVTAYQANFDKFQSDLEARNANFEKQIKSVATVEGDARKQLEEVTRLSTMAEGMLKGSTNAGLAGSFSEKQTKIDAELKKARTAYYASIALLLILTIPVFLYSLPRELVISFWTKVLPFDPAIVIGKEAAKTDYEQISQFLARALLLLPGFLLVRFTSFRHEKLFQLREHYAYKYSIATSVEGFQRQAGEYANEIAASSYFELARNPTEALDRSDSDARLPNPVWEWLMRKIESKWPTRDAAAAKK